MEHIGTKEIQTNRLILRQFNKDDYLDMYNNYCSSLDVSKYVTWDAHANIEVTKDFLNDFILKKYASEDAYRWAICLKEDNKVIGSIDYIYLNEVGHIGYCLSFRYWNKGIMTEALNAIIEYAFKEVKLKALVAEHIKENVGSGRVMQKCHMEYIGTNRRKIKNVEWDVMVYKIDNPYILQIRKAKNEDLDKILAIYAYAREFMRKNNNPNQWGSSRPNIEKTKEDIEKEQLYVITLNKEIHGVFAFIIGEDPTYNIIKDGHWLSNEKYGTIHRIASDGKVKGIFNCAINFCYENIHHLRIDTHEDNKILRHLNLKNGFIKCGIIYCDNGTERIAYEKM